jgi:hypothetical protein
MIEKSTHHVLVEDLAKQCVYLMPIPMANVISALSDHRTLSTDVVRRLVDSKKGYIQYLTVLETAGLIEWHRGIGYGASEGAGRIWAINPGQYRFHEAYNIRGLVKSESQAFRNKAYAVSFEDRERSICLVGDKHLSVLQKLRDDENYKGLYKHCREIGFYQGDVHYGFKALAELGFVEYRRGHLSLTCDFEVSEIIPIYNTGNIRNPDRNSAVPYGPLRLVKAA